MKKIGWIVGGLLVGVRMGGERKVRWSMEVGVGMSWWMGKDGGDCCGLFKEKVGVGIDVGLSGVV